MSRITCLIIFSGSSALSIRSLRLARTNVETRSSNAMVDSFFAFGFWPLALSSWLVELILLLHVHGARRRNADTRFLCAERCRQWQFLLPCRFPATARHVPPSLPARCPAQRPTQFLSPFLSVCFSYASLRFARCGSGYLPLRFARRDSRGRLSPHKHTYFATSTTGGFGVLSPICRTLPSNSESGMPESVSNNAGTCAAILAMSPVILFMPEASPFPVETMVILSTLASGLASAFTISGIAVNSRSITAAWLYS